MWRLGLNEKPNPVFRTLDAAPTPPPSGNAFPPTACPFAHGFWEARMLSSSNLAVSRSPWKPGRSRRAGNLRASRAAARWPVPSSQTALGLGAAENWSDGARARRLWLANVTPETLVFPVNLL